MKKFYDWQQNLKKGNLYLKNFEYLKAKSEFTKALSCKNIPIEIKENIHLRRIITNFHLKGNNYLKEIEMDEKEIPASIHCFEFWYLHILDLDQSGEIDSAIKNIELEIIRHMPNRVNEFNDLIIHLSNGLQAIYKIRTN